MKLRRKSPDLWHQYGHEHAEMLRPSEWQDAYCLRGYEAAPVTNVDIERGEFDIKDVTPDLPGAVSVIGGAINDTGHQRWDLSVSMGPGVLQPDGPGPAVRAVITKRGQE